MAKHKYIKTPEIMKKIIDQLIDESKVGFAVYYGNGVEIDGMFMSYRMFDEFVNSIRDQNNDTSY